MIYTVDNVVIIAANNSHWNYSIVYTKIVEPKAHRVTSDTTVDDS